MAIYTRWGEEVTVVENNGIHQPRELNGKVTLVKLKYQDGEARYYFAEFLRADGGWLTISRAAKEAPVVVIKGKALKEAIRQALP